MVERPKPSETAPSYSYLTEQFLLSDNIQQLSDLTQKAYRADLINFGDFLDSTKQKNIKKVDEKLIRDYLSALKPNTALRKRSTLNIFYTWAIDVKHLQSNPVSEINPEYKKNENSLSKPLTIDEFKKLIQFFNKEPGMQFFCIVAITTGARVQEILDLRKENFSPNLDGSLNIVFGQGREISLEKTPATRLLKILNTIPGDGFIMRSIQNQKKDVDKQIKRSWANFRLQDFGRKNNKPNLNPTNLRHMFVLNFNGTSKELANFIGITTGSAEDLLLRKDKTAVEI